MTMEIIMQHRVAVLGVDRFCLAGLLVTSAYVDRGEIAFIRSKNFR